jgi:hypothetical protein
VQCLLDRFQGALQMGRSHAVVLSTNEQRAWTTLRLDGSSTVVCARSRKASVSAFHFPSSLPLVPWPALSSQSQSQPTCPPAASFLLRARFTLTCPASSPGPGALLTRPCHSRGTNALIYPVISDQAPLLHQARITPVRAVSPRPITLHQPCCKYLSYLCADRQSSTNRPPIAALSCSTHMSSSTDQYPACYLLHHAILSEAIRACSRASLSRPTTPSAIPPVQSTNWSWEKVIKQLLTLQSLSSLTL